MNIYVGHSNEFDYKKELYKPIRKSELNDIHHIVLPHEKSNKLYDSKEFLKRADVFIAEVSHKSTGLGIELGWANTLNVEIVCIYKKGCKVSSSLQVISKDFIEYLDTKDLIEKLSKRLNKNKKQ